MIALPPVLEGAVHDMVACPSPGVPDTAVGAPGTANGVTAADADDTAPVPTALVAVTVNVYAVPLPNPVTVADVAPVVDAVKPPGDEVTV